MKVGDLVINRKRIIGCPANSIGVVIDTRYPRPEILDRNECRIVWTNGRIRWIDKRLFDSLFEVISENR